MISVNILYLYLGLVCSSCFFVLQLLYTLSEMLFGLSENDEKLPSCIWPRWARVAQLV